MLIKHCVCDHCSAPANEDLSVNEHDYGRTQGVFWSLVGDGGICAHTPALSSAFYIPLAVVNTDASIEIYGRQECLLFPL